MRKKNIVPVKGEAVRVIIDGRYVTATVQNLLASQFTAMEHEEPRTLHYRFYQDKGITWV